MYQVTWRVDFGQGSVSGAEGDGGWQSLLVSWGHGGAHGEGYSTRAEGQGAFGALAASITTWGVMASNDVAPSGKRRVGLR